MKCEWACRRNEWRANRDRNEEIHQWLGCGGSKRGELRDDSWFESGQKGKFIVNSETEQLKRGMSEEERHLVNFGQVWLDKSLCVDVSREGKPLEGRAGFHFCLT